MKLNKNSVVYVIGFVGLVALVCSLIISTVAVSLKQRQEDQKAINFQKSVLEVAKIQVENNDIIKTYNDNVEVRYVDLNKGKWATESDVKAIGNNYADVLLVSKYRKYVAQLPSKDNIAGLKNNEYAWIQPVYLIKDKGQVSQVILPFYGNGLWSVMYGLLAIEPNGNTVKNIIYYQQGETPGLGGEVENPNFTKQFEGKQIYNLEGSQPTTPLLQLEKNASPSDKYHVNALTGATLTSNGVSNQLQFWLGDKGFGKFLHNLRMGEVTLNEPK